MDDPGGLVGGHEHQFEEASGPVCSDDEDSNLAVVLLLAVPDGVVERVEHVGVVDPVLPGAPRDFHNVNISLTLANVNEVLTRVS